MASSTSPMASWRGFPFSNDIRAARRHLSWAMRSPAFRKMSTRSSHAVPDQEGKAFHAASMAVRASFAVPFWKLPRRRSRSPGEVSAKVPSGEVTSLPLMALGWVSPNSERRASAAAS